MSQPQLFSVLRTWLQSGVVAALLITPPKGTWSEARLPLGSNRPLRSAHQPLCMPGRSVKEIEQLVSANLLLYVAIRLVFAAVVHGLPCLLAHAPKPKRRDRPSIWSLPWIQILLDNPEVSFNVLPRVFFDTESMQPIHMLTRFLPHFRQDVQQCIGPLGQALAYACVAEHSRLAPDRATRQAAFHTAGTRSTERETLFSMD